MANDVLYFDGAYLICRAEMSQLRKLKKNVLNLIYIHSFGDFKSLPSQTDLLTCSHVRRDSQWTIGAYANVAAWQHTSIGLLWPWLR